MSRIGKQQILVPKTVKVGISGQKIHVDGPKGKLDFSIDPSIEVKVEGDHLTCSVRKDAGEEARARHGLTRNILANMVKGCAEGFRKELDVVGVGYRAALKGRDLELSLGFSHPVIYKIREGITIAVDAKTSKMTIEGADRQVVGQTAAEIRLFRKPEPYKGKGIKYSTEVIKRKAGKAAAGATTA
jgi:large subunit ribosomal protein L6